MSRVLFFVVGFLFGGAEVLAQAGLPMAAALKDRSYVYATNKHKPLNDPDRLPVKDLAKGTYVIAWEQDAEGRYCRITPAGFAPEAWVQCHHLGYTPGVELQGEPEYLSQLKAAFDDHVDRSTVRYCGVVIEDVQEWREDLPTAEPEQKKRWGRTEPDPWMKKWATAPIYRVTESLVEVHEQSFSTQWVERKHFELREPFADAKNPCTAGYPIFELPKFTVVEADSLREGPIDAAPPTSFFAAGAVLQVAQRFPGGWYYGGPPASNGARGWFKASTVQPYGRATTASQASAAIPNAPQPPAATSFPVAAVVTGTSLRVRVGPGTEYPVALTLDAGSVLVVYELRNGWFRLTPFAGEHGAASNEDFPLPAWVAKQYVSLRPDAPLNTSYFAAMRTNRLARKPDFGRPTGVASGSGGPSCFVVAAWVVGALVLIAFALRFRKQLGAIASAAWVSLLFLLYDLWIRRRLRRAQAATGEQVMRDDDNDEEPGSLKRGRTPVPKTPADMAALSEFSERPSIIGTKIAALIHEKKLSIVQQARLAEINAKTQLTKALSEYGRSQEELEHYSRPELAKARRATTGLEHELKATEAETQLFEAQQKLAEAKRRVEAAKAGSQRPAGPKPSAAERMFEEVSSQEKTARELWQLFEEQKTEWEKLRDAGTISKDECLRRVENLRDRINRKLEEQEV